MTEEKVSEVEDIQASIDAILFPEITFKIMKDNIKGKNYVMPEVILQYLEHGKSDGMLEIELSFKSTNTVQESAFEIEILAVLIMTVNESATDEYLNTFIQNSALFISWPYIRELLSSLVQRSGVIPPLYLPLIPPIRAHKLILFRTSEEEEDKPTDQNED